MNNPALSPWRYVGPLRALLVVFAVGLAWLSLSRVVLMGLYWERLTDVAAWRILALGLRMDVLVLCQLITIPAALYLLLPNHAIRDRVVAILLTLFAVLMVNMELTTPNFIAEYDKRPDRIYYDYFFYPREVGTMLVKTYPVQLVIVAILLVLTARGFWRLWHTQTQRAHSWPWTKRALVFPLLTVLLFVGIRSSLGHRPANLSTAAFSNNHLANELAVSSIYTLFSAIYATQQEVDAASLYGAMAWHEVQARVKRYMNVPEDRFTNAKIPTLHRGSATNELTSAQPLRPPNLVIFVLESFGAEFVASLGGLPLAPYMEKLSSTGLWFTNLYATGTRTVRGLEAIVTGFPPTAAPSVLKLPSAQRNFFTLGQLLSQHGFATEFIYGGMSNFDNMGKFFRENGFQRVIEQKDFSAPVMLGTWGVSDEDLVIKAHETFLAYGDQPFFALLLSTSNHVPFEFPLGRIEPYEQPANTRNNAVLYTDYAVGKLFALARQSSYWDHTIFLVVADHDARVYGADLVPIKHFHIPALIVGPQVPQQHYTQVASQIDLGPTLIGLLGIKAEQPMIGRDLLTLPSGTEGRAMMQYSATNGLRVGDKVVIHQPHLPAQTFIYSNERLIAAPHDVELERDALAHLLWADRSYRERLYRLPVAKDHL